MASRQFCLVDKRFVNDGTGEVVLLAVFRERRDRPLEVGTFLIDLGCTGVKDAFSSEVWPIDLENFKDDLFPEGSREESVSWARKLIEDSLAYARSLGMKAHRDYKKAARVLGGIRADDCETVFHFGKDGKPFYVQGKHTDEVAQRIVNSLALRLGPEGFHFLINGPSAFSEKLEDRISYFLDEAESGRLKRARAGIKELEAENPEVADVHCACGVLESRAGEFEAAIDSFDRAIELDPVSAEAWMGKALAHRDLYESFMMARCLQKVVDLTPAGSELHEAGCEVLRRMDAALQELEGMNLQTYVETETLYVTALEHFRNEEFSEALRIVEENLDRIPVNERSLAFKGSCHRHLGQVDLARDAYERALEIDPGCENAILGLMALNLGNRDSEFAGSITERLNKNRAAD